MPYHKRVSYLINVKAVANFSHYLEDILQYLGENEVVPSDSLSLLIEDSVDHIAVMLDAMKGIIETPKDSKQKLIQLIEYANLVNRGDSLLVRTLADEQSSNEATTKHSKNIKNKPNPFNTVHMKQTSRQLKNQTTLHEPGNIVVPLKLIQKIMNVTSEMTIALGQTDGRITNLRSCSYEFKQYDDTLRKKQFELENIVSQRGLKNEILDVTKDFDNDFDRLEMDEYNEVYDATQGYIESVTDSIESSKEIYHGLFDLENLFIQQKKLNRELQDIVMSVRSIPVSDISTRLHRIIRQTARATNKQVDFTIKGEKLMVDAGLIRSVLGAIMHILRNAVDHGIEQSQQRLEKGKSSQGNITLSFVKKGNAILIQCTDDGVGLNYQAIKAQAVDKGLISSDENDKALIAKQILLPGFTTRSNATQISGRGVGLDVVYTTIMGLNGKLKIRDNNPCGTIVECEMPTKSITNHCVLIGLGGGKQYAVISATLKRVLAAGDQSICKKDDVYFIEIDGKQYPIKALATLLGMSYEKPPEEYLKSMSYLLQKVGNETFAISVDSVLSSNEYVIKKLGNFVKPIAGVVGVSLRRDGQVIPVLSLHELIVNEGATPYGNKKLIKQKLMPQALIVDDSYSARKTLAELVEDIGYKSVLARDGIEAIKHLEYETFDLILTDLEMPRMNGLELTSYIRRNEKTKNVPVLLVTSRTMQKHRQKASKVGVTEYITKPYTEDRLVEIIQQYAAIWGSN